MIGKFCLQRLPIILTIDNIGKHQEQEDADDYPKYHFSYRHSSCRLLYKSIELNIIIEYEACYQ